jgi:hypothetical protein
MVQSEPRARSGLSGVTDGYFAVKGPRRNAPPGVALETAWAVTDAGSLASFGLAGEGHGLVESPGASLGSHRVQLPQTMPDCSGAMMQVGGSPFDCARTVSPIAM